MKKQLFFLLVVTGFCLAGNSQACTITCNLTTSFVCPNSNTWKQNSALYNDRELMTSLGYSKDKNGCWTLQGNTTKTITGEKKKMQSLYTKIKRFFSTSKTGF